MAYELIKILKYRMPDHYRFYVEQKLLICIYSINLKIRKSVYLIYDVLSNLYREKTKKCTLSAIQTKAIDNKPEIDSQFFHIDF